jgi:hypothetical protein
MWATLQKETVSHLPRLDVVSPPGAASTAGHSEDKWNERIDKLLEIRRLEDDWDGQGADAPSPALVDSAIVLAQILRQNGVETPCRVVAGVNGTVILEWQEGKDTYTEIEVVEPYKADGFRVAPGQEPEHWTIG